MTWLSKVQSGKIAANDVQLRAAQTLIDRVLPKLSTVEQTIIDPRELHTEQDVMARLSALIDKNPALLDRLMEYRASQARPVQGVTVEEKSETPQ